jgi:hypothetical protein
MPFAAGIVMDLHTIIIQFGLFPPSIFETMQMDLYALPVKGYDLVKKIKNTPVIHRVGHIQANNMQVLIFHV